MSAQISGGKSRVVNEVQTRLDNFSTCSQAYEKAQKDLAELASKNVELADIPAHEDRYQTLLSQCETAFAELQTAAQAIRKKTNNRHIDKYFRPRRSGINRKLHAGPKDHFYIHPVYKDYLQQIHDVAKKIVKADYKSQFTQGKSDSQNKKTEALALLEARNIDQTFPSCRDKLLRENPQEYLRLAVLYQCKLLENNDPMAVSEFGNSWIKSLPKDATWEQVENMSFIMLQAAQKNESVDITEYRDGVQQWLKEHPLPDSADKIPMNRRTYMLGLLYLNSEKTVPSFHSNNIYRECGVLYPEQRVWKVKQALYHISRREWVQAKEMLAGLPVEDDLIRDVQTILRGVQQERICCAVLDLGPWAMSRVLPSSWKETVTFDAFNTGLQLVSNGPVRRMWIPLVFRKSGEPIPIDLPYLTIASMVGDVVDFAFRNIARLQTIQKVESFATTALRIPLAFRSLYDCPSLISSLNVGSLIISSIQSYDVLKETRRPATHQAFLSTVQILTYDTNAAISLAFYSDLLSLGLFHTPQIVRQVGQVVGALFTAQTVTASREDNQEFSRKKWLVVAVAVGSRAGYVFYYEYPCIWAAAVMRDAEFYSSQGKYDEVDRVFTESEASYFVSKARPTVRNYAIYLSWLKNYPQFLQKPEEYKRFLLDLDCALASLKESTHYRGLRSNLQLKKMDSALRQQDFKTLKEVIEEKPNAKIVVSAFHTLLTLSYYLALKETGAGCSLLKEMGAPFPPSFHPARDSLAELIKTESESFGEWQGLELCTCCNKAPSDKQIVRWMNAIRKLQDFFSENIGKTEVYQALQYYELLIAFANHNTENAEAVFKSADPALHHRFTRDLVLLTKQLIAKRKPLEAIALLERVNYKAFNDNALMQNYGRFLSLLCSTAQKADPYSEQMETLDCCVAGLDLKINIHQGLGRLFSFHRIVLSFDAGKFDYVDELLAKESTDSEVPAEVATFLFERIRVSMRKKGEKKALSDLNSIILHLGSWRHQELFKAFQAYLSCEPSREVKLGCLRPVIAQLKSIEMLTEVVDLFEAEHDVLLFEIYLSCENFEQAKEFLTGSKHTSKLCDCLFPFFVYRGEQLRQKMLLKEVKKELVGLIKFLAPSHTDIVHTYVNFLDHLARVEGKQEITLVQKARQALQTVFKRFNQIEQPVPLILNKEMGNILMQIALLAQETCQWKIALEALESIKEIGLEIENLDDLISGLKRMLNIPSKEK
jgi:hypothetical protein